MRNDIVVTWEEEVDGNPKIIKKTSGALIQIERVMGISRGFVVIGNGKIISVRLSELRVTNLKQKVEDFYVPDMDTDKTSDS